jgi:hypothetical protein
MSQDNTGSPKVFIHSDGVDHATGASPSIASNVLATAASFTITAGASNVCNVAIAITDNASTPNTLARAHNFEVWLCDASTGIGLTATTASGTVQAKSASGTVMGVLTTKKMLRVQSLATGIFTLEITDSAKTGFFVAVKLDTGAVFSVSRQLVSGDYGA